MLLGVMSDTHGNNDLMFRVAEQMVNDLQVDWIYHAGDDYRDAELLDFSGYKVRAVPGLWCPQYNDGRTPRRILDEYDGFSVSMAHADKDLRSLELAATAVITGHTHRARVEKVGRTLYLNPGHLKGLVDRGHPASFATLEFAPARVRASLHAIDGDILCELTCDPADL
ncbi:MAG: metallophosphoesterase family protein [FCB group bacterium]|jgi:putative phosphoesterase|nr:metallophosphoesterase family protein [FCB group bacterium]